MIACIHTQNGSNKVRMAKGRDVIRPNCITILYRNSSLFIDIFHITMMFLCGFGLFYTVCNFPVPKQQTQDSAGKSGHQVDESEGVKISGNSTEGIFWKNDTSSQNRGQRGPTRISGDPLARPPLARREA